MVHISEQESTQLVTLGTSDKLKQKFMRYKEKDTDTRHKERKENYQDFL